jgi:hypothetical protein
VTTRAASGRPADPTWEETVLAYVMYAATGKQEYHWAIDVSLGMAAMGRWSDLWRFTRDVVAAADTSDPDVLAFIGAGPLEDILAHAGDQFIDSIEAEARTQPRFRSVLACAWQSRMPESLWARVVAASAAEQST